MATDIFLDTSWSTQYIPDTHEPSTICRRLTQALQNKDVEASWLESLSTDCFDYIVSRARAEPKNDLNDTSEKTGTLKECALLPTYVETADNGSENGVPGLVVEARYQKATYRVILLAGAHVAAQTYRFVALLSKGTQSRIKHLKDWLEFKFDLPWAESLQLPSELILSICSKYLFLTYSDWTSNPEAARDAALKQVVGTLKITVTFSNSNGGNADAKLKTIDLDIPNESVGQLLELSRKNSQNNFLVELEKALHQKTGLRLPLLPSQDNNDGDGGQVSVDAPLRVTRISCASFALAVDGRVKLASKPIEGSEVLGYQGQTIRSAYAKLLATVVQEAARRSAQHKDN